MTVTEILHTTPQDRAREAPHPLVIPEHLGTARVVRATELHPHDDALRFDEAPELTPALVEKLKVDDPYITALKEMPAELLGANPNDEMQVNALDVIRLLERDASHDAKKRRMLLNAWNRKPGTAYQDHDGNQLKKGEKEWGDPITSTLFFETDEYGVNDPALAAWQTLVPFATALRYLVKPEAVEFVIGADGNRIEATDTTRYWLAGCTDAEAIRSRGAGLNRQVAEFMDERFSRVLESNPHEQLSVLSVACGTADPTLRAVMEAGATDAKVYLADIDQEAMEQTTSIAKEMGFAGDITTYRTNIFSREVMRKLKESFIKDGVDNRPWLVDAMGIFEYTGEEFRPPHKADSQSLMYDPASFLKSVFDLVRPGGRMVFGQMRKDRPNADFTMGVVRWPYVSMRSPKEVMEIVAKAGIDPSCVKLGLTPEGVYTIASVDKPSDKVQVGEWFTVSGRVEKIEPRGATVAQAALAAGAAVATKFVHCSLLPTARAA